MPDEAPRTRRTGGLTHPPLYQALDLGNVIAASRVGLYPVIPTGDDDGVEEVTGCSGQGVKVYLVNTEAAGNR